MMNFMTSQLTYSLYGKIKEATMGRTCSYDGRDEERIQKFGRDTSWKTSIGETKIRWN
jgi:hypothetical protein